MKKSIANRIVKSFLMIIIFTVFTIDFFLIIGLKNFYYSNIRNEIENRLMVSIDSFEKFYSDKSLNDILLSDADIWAKTNSQVQILNEEGFVMLDSLGALPTDPVNTSDIIAAKQDKVETYVGVSNYTEGKIMSIAGKLKNSDGNTIGYLRFTTSLQRTDRDMLNTSLMVMLFELVIIIITAIISVVLANTIVKPIKELTGVAEKMADGQYKVRSELKSKDELGQLSMTLNKMAEEIVNKEQIKNDFISSISHELRTPLTSIKGWAVVLKGTDEKEKQLIIDGLTIIENESDRLANMVEELLDFSRFISGRITLDKDAFNITDICNDVAKQMGPRAAGAQIDFINEIEDKKVIIIGDKNRIRQLLINLLDNALKFTSKEGWVKFGTYVDDNKFIILISDNGMGISKEELNHVKEKFYKGKHSKSHSGIGLSISDEITRLHDGNLQIFSEYKIGTTVRVELPIPPIEKEKQDEKTF
ncbi:MAG: HAMP domain-containing sensor histidine kinase [Peptoniphilus sp.]|nr:HAMP domain-containing sensor histidine kinase [Peptoniphilus sp.]